MAAGVRTDPYRAFNFRIEFDGLTATGFSECSGLTADGDAVDYREGIDAENHVRKLTGLRKFTNLTFKRGYTQQTKEMWAWYTNILNGVNDRRHGHVILMDEAHNDVLRWAVSNAFINKIEGPSFKASGNDVAIESVELVHEGITLDT